MLSKTQLAKVERSWRGVVFGVAARRFVLSWLALSVVSMLASPIPAIRGVSIASLHYLIPAGFVLLVWGAASSFSLTAALCFIRRDIVAGIWMSVWAVLLAFLGASVVQFVIRS